MSLSTPFCVREYLLSDIAHLIAAAPEMLVALENVSIYLAEIEEEDAPIGAELLRTVNMLIAKARGQQ